MKQNIFPCQEVHCILCPCPSGKCLNEQMKQERSLQGKGAVPGAVSRETPGLCKTSCPAPAPPALHPVSEALDTKHFHTQPFSGIKFMAQNLQLVLLVAEAVLGSGVMWSWWSRAHCDGITEQAQLVTQNGAMCPQLHSPPVFLLPPSSAMEVRQVGFLLLCFYFALQCS